MSLDTIPAGARVLIDANILIYAKRAMSVQCRRLLERCARHEVNAVLTTIVVAEFCHRRMMQESQSRGLSGANPATKLPSPRQCCQSRRRSSLSRVLPILPEEK